MEMCQARPTKFKKIEAPLDWRGTLSKPKIWYQPIEWEYEDCNKIGSDACRRQIARSMRIANIEQYLEC